MKPIKNKQLEKFLTFCDNHQKTVLNINLSIFTIASALLFVFHNEKHGCTDVSISYDLLVTVFPLIVFLSGYQQSAKSNESNRRILTLIFLSYLATSIMLLVGYSYNSFATEMTIKQAIIFTIPLIVFVIIIWGSIIPDVIKKAREELIFLIKLFFGKL